MSEKFDRFKAALEALCKVHGVSLESGYDNITVYDNLFNPNEDYDDKGLYMEDETGYWELNYGNAVSKGE